MGNDVVYRYTGTGFRRGVPQKDLTAEQVARLSPAVLKDITGGDTPFYVPVKVKAPAKAPDKPAAAPKE